MLQRYNILGEAETAAALALQDPQLSVQPTGRNVPALAAGAGSEEGQKRHKTGSGSA